MKKTPILLVLLVVVFLFLYFFNFYRPLNTYVDKDFGFEFTYPKKSYVYAVDKISTSTFDIVFNSENGRATEIPLARIHVTVNEKGNSPMIGLDKTRDFEGFSKLTSEKIIKENPMVIEFTWTFDNNQSLFYKEYRVVKINKDNVNYFDLENGEGFTPKELRDTALSFKFNNKITDSLPALVAQSYVQNHSADGIKFVLILVKEVGNWIKYRVVPKDTSMDEAQLFMEKVDGEWVVQGFGTSFESLEKSHPELFK